MRWYAGANYLTTPADEQMKKEKTAEQRKREYEYGRKHRIENREKYIQWKRDYRIRKKNDPEYRKKERIRNEKYIGASRKNRELLRKEKGNKCSKCGYDNEPRILHFHHLRDKEFLLSDTMFSYEQMRSEADKCVLLCPNCHALEHLTYV